MNRTGIRDKLVTTLDTAWTAAHPTIPVYYENTQPLDKSSLPDVFLYCVVDFLNAEQINIDPSPDTRYSGNLEITAFTRETLGTRSLLTYMDELTSAFAYKNLSGVHLGVPDTDTVKTIPGWYGLILKTPFYADSNA